MLRVIEVPVDHYVRQLDEIVGLQPRHVIERLIDHVQHPALRHFEGGRVFAQIEAQPRAAVAFDDDEGDRIDGVRTRIVQIKHAG